MLKEGFRRGYSQGLLKFVVCIQRRPNLPVIVIGCRGLAQGKRIERWKERKNYLQGFWDSGRQFRQRPAVAGLVIETNNKTSCGI